MEKRKQRPVLKTKQFAFGEDRYHGGKESQDKGPTDPLGQLEQQAQLRLTDARIQKALRKTGYSGSFDDVDGLLALIDAVVTDIWQGLEQHCGALISALTKEDGALLKSTIFDLAQDAVKVTLSQFALLNPQRYYVPLALAFLRGHFPHDASIFALLQQAKEKELSVHNFKKKSGPPRVSQVISLLKGIAPQSLLDIGAGRGAFLWPLLAQFNTLPVFAIDRLHHRVHDINAVRRGGISRVIGIPASVTQLPFAAEAFDVVTILEVLEHLSDPAAAVEEVLRVAARFVIASVPSHPDNNPEHIQRFSRQSLTELFLQAGVTSVQLHAVLNHLIAVVHLL